MKILIVDDSRAMRMLIARTLKSMDLPDTTYLEAGDGGAALKAVQELRPELVISDFNMPGMSGMDLLRAIRVQGFGTRFGFVTSEASAQLHQEADQAGASFVITKPFTAADVSRALSPIFAGTGHAFEEEEESPADQTRVRAYFPLTTILKELLRREVTVAPAPIVTLPLRNGYILVEYLRAGDGVPLGCLICDIACAVRLGAALTLIPPAVAAEAIATGKLEGSLTENFREVLNVMSRLFDRGGSSRVRLGPIHRPGEALPLQLAGRVRTARVRADTCIDIAGYGKGNITLLALM